MPRRRPVAASLICAAATLATAAAAITTTSSAAAAGHRLHSVRLNSFESALLADMNQARHNAGLHPLTIEAGATDVARRWSRQLARQQALEHNPNLVKDLQHAGSPQWHAIRENVGYGPEVSPDVLFQAYMHSPEHKANILGSDVRYVGVGVVQRGTYAWNTVDFVDSYRNSYGAPRVPADGIQRDAKVVAQPELIATPSHSDQRFGATASGRASASRMRLSHGAAKTTLRGRSGQAGMLFRQALTMAGASRLTFRLAAAARHHRTVPVAVSLGDGWADQRVAVVRVNSSGRRVSVQVPVGVRADLSTLQLTVSGKALRRAGHHLTLSLSRLRATN